MNTCLKTGGLVEDDMAGEFWEADLHTVGHCVIIRITYPPVQQPVDRKRVMLTIRGDAACFRDIPKYEDHRRYGTIVAEQIDCTMSGELKKHINRWYNLNDYQFVHPLD